MKVGNKGLGTGYHGHLGGCEQREIKKQSSLFARSPQPPKALKINSNLWFGTLSSEEWAEWGPQRETGGGGHVGERENAAGRGADALVVVQL